MKIYVMIYVRKIKVADLDLAGWIRIRKFVTVNSGAILLKNWIFLKFLVEKIAV